MHHGRRLRVPEHHVQLREPEHESVAPVDQDDVGTVAEFRRQSRRQLQPGEPRPEHHDTHGREDS